MSRSIEIDTVLAEIAAPFAREADTLLDLRDAASTDSHPGRCVSCYFKLLAAQSGETEVRLSPLRRWLEERIEIAASPQNHNTCLERFPLQLQAAHSLEECCHQLINTVMLDRQYEASSEIALQFRFREALAS